METRSSELLVAASDIVDTEGVHLRYTWTIVEVFVIAGYRFGLEFKRCGRGAGSRWRKAWHASLHKARTSRPVVL